MELQEYKNLVQEVLKDFLNDEDYPCKIEWEQDEEFLINYLQGGEVVLFEVFPKVSKRLWQEGEREQHDTVVNGHTFRQTLPDAIIEMID